MKRLSALCLGLLLLIDLAWSESCSSAQSPVADGVVVERASSPRRDD
ncbi:MAG: hypothetical protein AAGA33_04185 [Pseudomonadota bacterium]